MFKRLSQWLENYLAADVVVPRSETCKQLDPDDDSVPKFKKLKNLKCTPWTLKQNMENMDRMEQDRQKEEDDWSTSHNNPGSSAYGVIYGDNWD
ncbi:hypothetical protein [Stenoxybacter acetivorans]|uniref:hypothetical protein n=1 Tax=Stenoxybacter acetivorans TaxID=422441 RepID=UPI00056AD736|nr:hypothetical protein [Stenoxybacter acetivorans]